MFADCKLAIDVMEDLLAINTMVNASLLNVQERATAKEFAAYRKIISRSIMLNFDVLAEVWRTHPEICPKEFRLNDDSVEKTGDSKA